MQKNSQPSNDLNPKQCAENKEERKKLNLIIHANDPRKYFRGSHWKERLAHDTEQVNSVLEYYLDAQVDSAV